MDRGEEGAVDHQLSGKSLKKPRYGMAGKNPCKI